jgi:predicted XRE-type DNA-binding protein
METWKDIPEFEGLYQASTLGNIRSLDKVVPKWNKPFKRKVKGRVLKKNKINGGYNAVALHKDLVQKSFKVSRLIAKTFVDNPENKPEVNHINSDRTDDRACNLEWCTRSENMKHSYKHGNNSQKGENNAFSTLTKKEVLEIRKLFKEQAIPQKDLAEMFNISRVTIHNVVRRKTWSHL